MEVITEGFEEFANDLGSLIGENGGTSLTETMLKSTGKQMGASLARNTPTYEGVRDDYPVGQLKAGWFGGRRNANVNEYVNTMPVKHVGNDLEITFENRAVNTSNMEFGQFVEEGHAQEVGRYVGHNEVNARLVRPFIEGLRFTEKSINETEQMLQGILDAEFNAEISKHVR